MRDQALNNALSRFGSAIRHQRRYAGISQEELAYRSGLHRTYVTDIERGVRNVTLKSITRLASALNVTLVELTILMEKLEADPPAGEAGDKKKSAHGSTPVQLLIVEDDPRHTERILSTLTRNKLANQAHSVRTGEEAEKFLFERSAKNSPTLPLPPHIILLDSMLPDMKGTELVRRIRSHQKFRTLPGVILMTSGSSDETGIEKIAKPFEFSEFSAIISRLEFRWMLME